MALQKATFGMGCFWQSEEIFRVVKGVKTTAVGFMGGELKNPSYEDVSYKNTGHAEVVYLEYDPEIVSYEELLKVFWGNHDPTQMNRQGPDVGNQYRSAIFYYNKEQQNAAEKMLQELKKSGRFKKPIVTEIEAAGDFYRAEEYHQRYLEKKGIKVCH